MSPKKVIKKAFGKSIKGKLIKRRRLINKNKTKYNSKDFKAVLFLIKIIKVQFTTTTTTNQQTTYNSQPTNNLQQQRTTT